MEEQTTPLTWTRPILLAMLFPIVVVLVTFTLITGLANFVGTSSAEGIRTGCSILGLASCTPLGFILGAWTSQTLKRRGL